MKGSRRRFLKTTATSVGLALGGMRMYSGLPYASGGAGPHEALAEQALFPTSKTSSRILWRIGVFNYSSGEFNCGVDPLTDRRTIDYSIPSQDPFFVVGESHFAKDWFAFQPGSRNASAGYRPHPFTIEFLLPDVPRGLYTLKVAVLVEHPSVPWLQTEINGLTGRYYFHPTLNYAMGDIASAWLPEYASDTVTLDLPTDSLRQGRNRLVLTAIDEGDDANAESGNAARGLNSGIVYDALQLEHDPNGEFESSNVSVMTLPTVFYKVQNNHLEELVDVFIRTNGPVRNGHVTLAVGQWTSTKGFGEERAFGEYRVEFAVPEFRSGTKGAVRLHLDRLSKTVPVELSPAKKWNIFVVPHVHLDIGFTDYQSKVAEVHSRNIDKALAILREHPTFRLSLDGTWVVQQFFQGRSEVQRQRFVESVRENKILVPAQNANLLTGLPTLETLIRSLYMAYKFHAQHGGAFDYANITDVPSYTWSYPSILAAAGLKYLAAGSNNHDAPILLLGHLHEKSPFWWEGPDGGRVLMWYSRHYNQSTSLFGMPYRIESGRDSLPLFLQIYSHPGYKSDAVIVYGTQGDNAELYLQQAELVDTFNTVYAYPKLRFSGFSEALQHIMEQAGDSIPTFRGDGGPYWEEGAASDARYVASARQNEHRALSAEKASTISSLIDPCVRPDRAALNRLWENLILFDEHTWTYSMSVGDPRAQETVGQLAVKDSRASEGRLQLDHLLGRALDAIGSSIPVFGRTLMVFNPLSWSRSGLVEIDLRDGLELIDLTSNQVVSYETLWTGRTIKHIRFSASGVPGMGYKCYRLARTDNAPQIDGIPPVGWSYWPQRNDGVHRAQHTPARSVTTLESPYYRVVLDPESGAVRSIVDKDLNKELVDPTGLYRFDQYLYVTGADEVPNRLIRFPNSAPPPTLDVHAAHGGRLNGVTRTEFGTVARLECAAVNTPRIATEIIVFNEQKKIEFVNRVHKTKMYSKEAVYFAFPFAMDHPQFLYEIQNGLVDPARDQLPGAGKEWFSVQHWVAAKQDGTTAAIVPVDAPLVTFGDVVRGTWASDFGARRGTVFSFVMNNYWEDNYVAGQGGDFECRYVLTSGFNLQPAQLSRLGWEEMTPLETNEIVSHEGTRSAPAPLGRAKDSFLEVDGSTVVMVAWKLAEDEQGSIMRFLEVTGQPGVVTLKMPSLNIKAAWTCDAVERKAEALSVASSRLSFPVKPFQIVTVRIQSSPA